MAEKHSTSLEEEEERVQSLLRGLLNETLENSGQTKSSIARKLGNMNRTYKSNTNMKINTLVSLLFYCGYRIADLTIAPRADPEWARLSCLALMERVTFQVR